MSKPLQESTTITTRDTLRLFAEALSWVWPLRGRFAVKLFLLFLGLLPWLFLPFPVKILIDQVALGMPVAEAFAGYPGWLRAILEWIAAGEPAEIAFRAVGGPV